MILKGMTLLLHEDHKDDLKPSVGRWELTKITSTLTPGWFRPRIVELTAGMETACLRKKLLASMRIQEDEKQEKMKRRQPPGHISYAGCLLTKYPTME